MTGANTNKMRQPIWWTAFGLLSTIIIGAITGFKFSTLDVHVYDTYYVFDSIYGVVLLTLIFGTGRYFYLLMDLLSDRYKIFALLFSILNAIAGFFIFVWAYASIVTILTFKKMYPDNNFSGHFLFVSIFLGLLTMQTIVEIKVINKLRRHWTRK